MTCPSLTFETWKQRLCGDCEHEGKLAAFSNLGDFCLYLLWKNGTEPTVEAIVSDGKEKTT